MVRRTFFVLAMFFIVSFSCPIRSNLIHAYRLPSSRAALQRRSFIIEARVIASKFHVLPSLARAISWNAFQVSRDYRVNPYLVLAVIGVESSFRPYSVNPNGMAYGLMQIVPAVHQTRVASVGGVSSIRSIAVNIRIGTAILAEYGARKRNLVSHALWRYSGGERGYATKVLRLRKTLYRLERATKAAE